MMQSRGSSQEQEWKHFQEAEIQLAIERILRLMCSRFIHTLFLVSIVINLVQGVSWTDLPSTDSGGLGLIAMLCNLGAPYIRTQVHKNALWGGVGFQLVFIASLYWTVLMKSVLMKEELMQHRVFLTGSMCASVVVNSVIHLPFRIRAFLASPLGFVAWMTFHARVLFVQPSVVLFGIFYNLALPLFVAHVSDKLKWQQRQAQTQLGHEHAILKETQATLQCMLASQWDASCTCDEQGKILSSTAQLDLLLGGGEDLTNKNLCDLTANTDDADRMLNLLKSIASSDNRQVLTLQSTIRSPVQSIEADHSSKDSFEVSICGIKLPPGSTLQSISSDTDHKPLFIGVKAIACENDSKPSYLSGGQCGNDDEFSDPGEAVDDFCSELFELEECEDASSVGRSNGLHDAASSVAGATSVAGTTVTGRIFEDFQRVKKSCADFSSRLEELARLGTKEHWLVSNDDLLLLPDVQLGAGGFGAVVLGLVHGTRVAVKLPHITTHFNSQRGLHALVNELRILRHVRHPNCVPLHGACIDPKHGDVALVFEFIHGRQLEAIIGKEKPLPPAERYSVLLDVCCSLRYLHALSPQIVHGDLKPSNVLVEEWSDGVRGKLLDFGLSRLMTKQRRPLGGSFRYMAPEGILGRPAVQVQGAKADVFSFGRLSYFIIATVDPFKNAKLCDIQAMVRRGFFDSLQWPQVPLGKECRNLSNEVLAFSPAVRPSMKSVHATVLSWVCGNEAMVRGGAKPVAWQNGLVMIRSTPTSKDGSGSTDVFSTGGNLT